MYITLIIENIVLKSDLQSLDKEIQGNTKIDENMLIRTTKVTIKWSAHYCRFDTLYTIYWF